MTEDTKITDLLAKYGYAPDTERISREIEAISANLDAVASENILKECLSFMDLTTLNPSDTGRSVEILVGKINSFPESFEDCPLPASVCVFPNLVQYAARTRKSSLRITAVSGCFPASQSFLEVKLMECRMAVEAGADEIDVVLPLNKFFSGDFAAVLDELAQIRNTVDSAGNGRPIVLKVILETGVLSSGEQIACASFLAMEAGADFIKTSTGKVSVNATPFASFVMCECIRKYYEMTGRRVGFKAAGGISSTPDALCYYLVVSTVLGSDWLCPGLFRFGVSRLANSLLSSIRSETIKYY